MRDLRLGVISVAGASLFVFTALAQQPLSGPTPDQAGADQKMSPLATGQAHFYMPTDQFAPSTVSAVNAEMDKRMWLDRGTALTADQKRAIYAALGSRSDVRVPPSPDLFAEPSAVIPKWVNLMELPDELKTSIPYIKDFKFVLAGDKVLLVDTVGGVVATVIEKPAS